VATILRGSKDRAVTLIKKALDGYEKQNPGAEATIYRQNSASIRVRIIDDRFARMSKSERHDLVWNFLADRLKEDVLQELSVLLLLAPSEQKSSFMNFEFNDPIPSGF
jgi:stress-induced morphogen